MINNLSYADDTGIIAKAKHQQLFIYGKCVKDVRWRIGIANSEFHRIEQDVQESA